MRVVHTRREDPILVALYIRILVIIWDMKALSSKWIKWLVAFWDPCFNKAVPSTMRHSKENVLSCDGLSF